MGDSWTDNEFGWEDVRAELARIRRRVRSRWLMTSVLALVLTALVVARQARRERTYQATVMLRVSEGQFDPNSSPPTSAQLQQYLWEVALSRSRLFKVMDKHNLYMGLRKLDPLMALDEMRDVMDIDVLRNDFRIERDPDAPPRSARIALHYSHSDPETALVVARALANLMAEEEAKSRQRTTEVALESMRSSASSLESQLLRARMEESQLEYAMAEGDPEMVAAHSIRLFSVRKRIEALQNEKSLTNKAVSNLGLRTDVEGKELGLRFEIIDPGRTPKVVISNATRLALLGILSFFILLPIAGVGVAAYDLRIYDADDLRRLGLEPFGHVPAFPGYRQGTLNERLKGRKGASC
jgi:hypothetical protein